MIRPCEIRYAGEAIDDIRRLRTLPTMKTVIWTEDTAWEATVRQAEHEEVLVMRDGHAVALLIPFDDDDLEWYPREHNPDFLASIAEARRQVQEGQPRGHSDLKKDLGLD